MVVGLEFRSALEISRAGNTRAYQWFDRSLRRIESELFNRLPATARLFDVGANMGLRSLYAMSQRRPVTMFEPNIELRGFTEEPRPPT
jgi:hypothetical protein